MPFVVGYFEALVESFELLECYFWSLSCFDLSALE